jgi:hypothetical protein
MKSMVNPQIFARMRVMQRSQFEKNKRFKSENVRIIEEGKHSSSGGRCDYLIANFSKRGCLYAQRYFGDTGNSRIDEGNHRSSVIYCSDLLPKLSKDTLEELLRAVTFADL